MKRFVRWAAGCLTLVLAVGGSSAQARSRPAKPVPPLLQLSGAIEYPKLFVTQTLYSQSKCKSTAVPGRDVNNLSASVVALSSKMPKNPMTVTWGSTDVAVVGFASVIFFDDLCRRVNVYEKKDDAGRPVAMWGQSIGLSALSGWVPPTATSVVLQWGDAWNPPWNAPLNSTWSVLVTRAPKGSKPPALCYQSYGPPQLSSPPPPGSTQC